jgi:formylglycine-generating enzyme required for sulfatase activity/class 3 adenylate cyclase
MRGEIRQFHSAKNAGSSRDPPPRRLAAIVAADIAGYSRLMGVDEEGTHARVKRLQRELVEPTIAEHQGRLVKTTGDGFIAIFDSPVEAVRCAIIVQQSMVGRNASLPQPEWIQYRIGVNLGDVMIEPNDIYGEGVNIAVRLESIATPGQVYISGGIYEQIRHKLVCGYQPLGDRHVKNITEPVRVYRVLPDPAAVAADRRKRRELALLVVALASFLLAVAGGAAWYSSWQQSGKTSREAQALAPVAPDTKTTSSPSRATPQQAGPATAPAATPAAVPAAPAAVPAAPAVVPQAASRPVGEPEMVSLSGGTFAMGSNDDGSERPIHHVAIKPFAISKFPVTVREWNECAAAKACPFVATGPDRAPVSDVSWNDAKRYVAWLAQETGKKYRLPSEAEWEYAARGGTRTKYWWGDQLQAGMVNCKECVDAAGNAQPLKVGSFQPNPFGLYDMGGSVDQWVEDCWHKNYQGAPVDGSAWMSGDCSTHVIRSGSWQNDASYVRPANRDHYDTAVRYPTHGFRVALSP